MLENFKGFFKKFGRKEEEDNNTGDAAKERLHLVLMQDRANVSVDFLDMMKQEIIEVIKKYIDIDEEEMDVRLTNQIKDDGTNGAPALYANIPIIKIKNEKKNMDNHQNIENNKIEEDSIIKSGNSLKEVENRDTNAKNENIETIENQNVNEDKEVKKVVRKVKSDDAKRTVTKIDDKATDKLVTRTTSKTTVKPVAKNTSTTTKKSTSSKTTKTTTSKK